MCDYGVGAYLANPEMVEAARKAREKDRKRAREEYKRRQQEAATTQRIIARKK